MPPPSTIAGDGAADRAPLATLGAVAMRRGGRSPLFAIAIWTGAALLLTAAVVVGRGVFSQFSEHNLAFPLAFAGGAVLASLADTLIGPPP